MSLLRVVSGRQARKHMSVHWELMEPVFNAPGKRGYTERTGAVYASGTTRCRTGAAGAPSADDPGAARRCAGERPDPRGRSTSGCCGCRSHTMAVAVATDACRHAMSSR